MTHSFIRLAARLAAGLLLAVASSWAPAQPAMTRAFDHAPTGFALTGLHANARCESCHLNGVFKGTPRDCASCHVSGASHARADVVRPPAHLPTQQPCDTCHNTQTFSGARFNHAGVPARGCTSCHNGATAPGKPAGHVVTTASCDSCHRTAAWRPAAGFDHSGVVPGSCATCHNGSRATGRPAHHVPVGSAACDACHRGSTAWRPTTFNHTQLVVANQCSSCHSGAFPPADGRHAAHIPYQAISGAVVTNCDTCHRSGYAAWAPARFHASVSVSAQCATCHSGSYPPAIGKPATPIHNGVTVCESCHKSTASWASARVDHSTFNAATQCASCHNGSAATGKPASHVPVGATSCIACHSTAAWRPSRWSHTQLVVANQCSSCHSGAYPPADGRPANHVPYQAVSGVAIPNCDTCHKSGYLAWTPARVHASVTIGMQCATCHIGAYPPAVGKPATAVHSGVTVCESCHRSTAAWSTVTFAHGPANAVGTGTCDTCHNGSAARGKPPTHIPVTTGAAKCDSCHRSQASWSAAVTMNHGVVATSTCKSCHSGSYVSQGTVGALAKPANHIPEHVQLLNGAAMDCSACHRGTTTWTSLAMNHNGSLGGGAGWCKGCHASGTNYLGDMEKKSPTHKTKTPPAIDCSESGCHRPLGSRGTPYTKWD
jgi:hypothetical protein